MLTRLLPAMLIVVLSASAATAQNVFPTAAVAADHAMASDAGVSVLRAGGNAVDAAVATSLTLSVVRPYSCGIGGGGFLVMWQPNAREGERATALCYRERSPGDVGPTYYEQLDDPLASRRGGRAAGVPGTVHGLLTLHERWGRLALPDVIAPAIAAAEAGFLVDDHYMSAATSILPSFTEHPEWKQRFSFVWERYLRQGKVRLGDRIRNPEQAGALRLIARDGLDAFYSGPIAQAMVKSVQADGGALTMADLAAYRASTEKPLRSTFMGHQVIGMPPPSSGGIAMAQIFGLLERRYADFGAPRHNSPDYTHLVVESMKHAFADRAEWLGDAAYVSVPVARLLDPSYLDDRARTIDPAHTRAPLEYGSRAPSPDDSGTSHFSIIDAEGTAIACTETINLSFGSLLAVDGFGFLMNDEMDDFLTRRGEPNAFGLRQSERNLPEPGKRPLSSMSPTIVLDPQGRVEIIAGASGGPRIITGTLQSILNVILFNMDATHAIGAARFHHQWMPDAIWLEPGLRAGRLTDALRQRGHDLRERGAVGNVQLIRRTEDGFDAACDPRKGGAPAGY